MKRQEIENEIRTGNYIPHSLWCAFNNPNARDGYALKFGFWDGEGEYQRIEFSNGESYFIKSITFDKLRLTCPNCKEVLKQRLNDIYECCKCNSKYLSVLDQPLNPYNS